MIFDPSHSDAQLHSQPARASDLLYVIDHHDRVVFVSEGWDRFALANAGDAATSMHVLEHPLWEFISDLTSREVYRHLLKRARAGSAVHFRFRCDSPDRRRLLEMSMAGHEAGFVEFRTRAISEENRRPPAWPVGTEAPAGELLRACGWCNRIMAGELWVEVEEAVEQLRLFEAPPSQLTHGICGDCQVKMTMVLADA